ncbi:hypothetical protein Q3G72_005241 [Acer saccharum]|nr:hypothetical protein Q3G72_005241 [Acer saccharum]
MEFEDISRKCEKLSLDEEDGHVERISGSLQEKGKQSLSLSLFGKLIANKAINREVFKTTITMIWQTKNEVEVEPMGIKLLQEATGLEKITDLQFRASNWNAENESRALLRDGVELVSTTVIKSGNVKPNRTVSETKESNKKELLQNVATPNKEKITEGGLQIQTRMEIIETTSNPVSGENVLIQKEATRVEDSRGKSMNQKKWKRLAREKRESVQEGSLNLGKRDGDMEIDECSERKKIRYITQPQDISAVAGLQHRRQP